MTIKPLITLAVLLPTCLLARPKGSPENFKELAIGDAAPDFTLKATDGKTYSLSDFSKPDVLMVYFTGTHCPTSHGVEGRLQQLVKDMADKSFGIVAINPNHNDGLRPDEFSYSQYTESFEDSARYAKDLGWTFPFLYDGDKQLVSASYGCLATPHVFVFDKERKLRYQGRYDDSRYADPKTVKSHDTRNAIDALLAGKPVPVEKTRPFGCSTKWRGKKAGVEADAIAWSKLPVTADEIDLKAVKALRANGTKKVRLINVWASWCAPCNAELPDIAAITRRYARRDLEVITIALDKAEDKPKVEKILGKHGLAVSPKHVKSLKEEGRTTNNYIYAGAGTDGLAEALDPEWKGPIPYTLLVDTDGKILMRVDGKIDQEKMLVDILKRMKTTW